MMIGDDLRHQQADFVRGVEFPGLLARIRGELANQIFVDEAQHIVVIASIRRHILDDIQQLRDRLCPRPARLAQVGDLAVERIEDLVKDRLEFRRNVPRKSIERIRHLRRDKPDLGIDPS